ncbi:hypothetical protein E4N83_02600 [Treponema denticola]|uniref:hypothetical protein n=1 Tax=Treponema denticola TaxID=158 RepID=UPI0020A2FB28|nr:hypothetical protein [Treponema denticola]UTC97198.1 hypothetical protein E4N83_02600 [Treponema denticola]
MKKTLIFILMILVLMVSSCNLFLKEEYGELVLSFDGTMPDGARALDANGLPVLSSSPLKINIIREDGYTITRELGAEEPKSLVELVPVGEKIEIIVTAINPSGQWSGRASHTVVSGQNKVTVRLNKNVSGLKNLLFTQTKTPDPHGSDIYNLTFYMGGKEVKAHQSQSKYEFGRDSKGRLYVIYYIGPPHVIRYTSEGESEIDGPFYSYFVNDYTTGKMYGINGSGDVYEIQENLLPSPATIANLEYYQGAAAINNNRVVWIRYDDPNNLEMSVKYLGPATVSPTDIKSDVTITGCEKSKVNDLFIRGDYVYVLFNTVNESAGSSASNLYSLGGVVRYNINNLTAPPVKIGFEDDPDFDDDDGVLEDYDYSANFYGAVKVIGFDEENIYIADDGFDAADTPAGARIVKNRNRIAALNIATNTLSFSDAGPAKWYNEWKEWRTPNTKMIVWRQESYNEYYYYQLDTGDEALTGGKKFTKDTHGYKDVFCYDLDGNLYIVDNYNSNINMYPQTEGIYTNQPIKNTRLSGFKPEKGIAVDTSALDGYKYLYYVDNNDDIKRLKWEKGEFAYANTESFEIQNTSIQGEVSAMAANKDGLFVAVKKNIGGNKYKITVKKYDRSGSLSSEMDISEGDKGIFKNPIVEDVYAMQILDGRLYALSYKTVGAGKTAGPSGFDGNAARAVVSGKLLDLGLTSKNLSARPQTLWSGTQEDKGYAPFRFIAIKPKELVIANDGFYGTEVSGASSINQRNKVLKFSSSGSLLSEGSSNASFSRELSHNPICGFIWY